MRYLLIAFCLCACDNKPNEELGEMTKQILKSKEGIDIRIMPVHEEKP